MNSNEIATVFGALATLVWCAFAVAWFLRASGVPSRLSAWFLRTRPWIRALAAVAVVAVVGYAGSKGRNGNPSKAAIIPQVRPTGTSQNAGGNGDEGEGFRFTSIRPCGDGIEFGVAWPTNTPDYAAIDIFHKRNFRDLNWRWIHRETMRAIKTLKTQAAGGKRRIQGKETYWYVNGPKKTASFSCMDQ